MKNYTTSDLMKMPTDEIERHFRSGPLTGSSQAIKPASAIAAAEDTLRAARVLAGRVEHVIDRLCGNVDTQTTGCSDGAGEGYGPPVLVRLRRVSEETDDAITRASAALDRLDVELN